MEDEKERLYAIVGNNLSEVIYNERNSTLDLRHIKFLNFNCMFRAFRAIDDETAILIAEVGD